MLEEHPPPNTHTSLSLSTDCAHVNLWITLLFIVIFNIPRKRSNLHIHYLCPLEVEEVALHHLIFTVNSAPVLEVGGK